MLDSIQHADFAQISRRVHAHFHAKCDAQYLRIPYGIFAESMRNISIPYSCLIPCSMQILGWMRFNIFAESLRNPWRTFLWLIHALFHAACRFYSNFTQILRGLQCGMRCGTFGNSFGIFLEYLRNLCGIHAESKYDLSMLDSLQYAYFRHISCRFHADFNEECDAQSLRNRCGIFAETMRNLSMRYPCLIPCSLQPLRKVHADFHAKCDTQYLQNLCGIHAEYIYALSMLDAIKHADFKQISRRF